MKNPLGFLKKTRYGILPLLLISLWSIPNVTHAAGWWDTISSTFSSVVGIALSPITLFILTLCSLLLGIVGVLFNFVILRTVFQFSTYFGNTEGMLTAWSIFRDVANIGLLFGFIFMGVLLILNVEEGHGHGGGISAKKAIPRLILFAVLLNFSLFASQAIIDVSNALASQFSNLAGMNCEYSEGQMTSTCTQMGISGKVIEVAGISSVFSTTSDAFNPVLHLILSLFVLITAMVLLAAAIMLIIRVVTLIFLMITSPIGFAGMAIPGLGDLASQWWHKLISQAFFAPVLLLLMFISLKLVDGMRADGSTDGIAKALSGTGQNAQIASGNMEIFLVFSVAMGMMLASLMAASKVGAMGASFATSKAAGMTVGLAGAAGRRTVGNISSRASEKIRKSPLGQTGRGRFLAGIADYGAKASFDMRGMPIVGGIKGLDLGKAQKGGYEGTLHAATEKREKYAKSLQQTPEDKAEEARLKQEQRDAEKAWATEKESTEDSIKDAVNENKAKASERAIDLKSLESQNALSKEQRAQEMKSLEAGRDRANAQGQPRAAAAFEAAMGELSKQHAEQAQKEAQAVADLAKKHVAESKTEADSITALQKGLREKEKAHKEKLARIEKDIKGEVDDMGNVISAGVGKNAASYRYAQDLHEDRLINKLGVAGRASHHAAESIVKTAGKGKIEKALADIQEATKSGEGGHGGGDAAPASSSSTDHGSGGGHGGAH